MEIKTLVAKAHENAVKHGFICTPQDETECLMYGKESLCKYRSRKPEGVAIELADAVIRIADTWKSTWKK